ncbi:MAG: type II toxin-antitoxin system VapC family toxin [Actinomycetota bacterium]|nr:type II toxin-antitoxin system VapC family toxin [Actinomycetota bacterium]
MRIYLDSSALVKLVQREPGSDALRRYLRRHRADDRVTSALARVEVVRAVLAGGAAAIAQARSHLARIQQIRLGTAALDSAATLAPGDLRSVDAVHLASALRVGAGLRAFVTYDNRMATAATTIGLPVEAPA